jgi:hypothetical protein
MKCRQTYGGLGIVLLTLTVFAVGHGETYAQTKTLEFGGALIAETSTLYLFGDDEAAYLYGLVAAATGVIVTDQLFLRKGGSLGNLVVGTAVGGAIGLLGAGIMMPGLDLFRGSPDVSKAREIIIFAYLVSMPALGAVLGYNHRRSEQNSLLRIDHNGLQVSYPIPCWKSVTSGRQLPPAMSVGIHLLQVEFQ